MQRLNVYSIHDQAADAYITPFFLANDELAKRAFYQCVQDKNHQFHQSPDDFCLFRIGEFEVTTGVLKPLETPATLGNGVQYLKTRSNQPLNEQIDIEG